MGAWPSRAAHACRTLPTEVRKRSQSGIPSTMKVARVSRASSKVSRPSARAWATSKPSSSRARQKASR